MKDHRVIETIHWHSLHPRYLGSQSRVLDLGANYGLFAREVTERFGCHCVAVEPSPVAFHGMFRSPLITNIQAAISDHSGVMSFHVASESTASSLLQKSVSHQQTIQVRALSLPDLLAELRWPAIDLLKVDIEGAEIAMLASCPDDLLMRVGQITIEFHDFCGITPLSDVRRTLDRLHDLGFFSVRMSRIGHQDTWLINRGLLKISSHELFFVRLVDRNLKGLRRVANRVFQKALGLTERAGHPGSARARPSRQ